jgi:hypothetical protein
LPALDGSEDSLEVPGALFESLEEANAKMSPKEPDVPLDVPLEAAPLPGDDDCGSVDEESPVGCPVIRLLPGRANPLLIQLLRIKTRKSDNFWRAILHNKEL